MLNVQLASEMRRINGGRLTGSLAVKGGGWSLRFFFDQGELALLDFGADKEHLLARQYLTYNKIGPELHQVVTSQLQSRGGRAQDYLLQQQLITPEEAEQVTRTLVEDSLCDIFGNPHQAMAFDAAGTPQAFDLARTAVKLRIQVEMLLRMVESRVAERDTVIREVPDWNLVFSLVEGAPDSAGLNDMERHVLHFVDGRKTVAEIAQALRESCINVSCYLINLKMQGFIGATGGTTRKLGGEPGSSTRSTLPAISPPPAGGATSATGAAPTPEAASADAMPPGLTQSQITEFQVYHAADRSAEPAAAPRRRASPALLAVLGAVLLVVAGLAWLVVQSERSQEVIDALTDKIQRDVDAHRWPVAASTLAQARDEAANDQATHRQLDEMVETFNLQFRRALDEAEEQVKARRPSKAETALIGMPDERPAGLWSEESYLRLAGLRAQVATLRGEIEAEAAALRVRVEDLLQAREVKTALALLAGKDDRAVDEARAAIDAWRKAVLEAAREDSRPIVERRELLDLVLLSEPDADHKSRVAAIRAELDRFEKTLDEGLAQLDAQLASGDTETVQTELPRWLARSRNHPRQQQFERLRQTLDLVRDRLDGLVTGAGKVVVTAAAEADLSPSREAIDKALRDLPKASNQEALNVTAALLNSLRPIVAAPQADGELLQLAAIDRSNLPKPLVAALAAREARLRDLVQSAGEELTRAQDLKANGEVDKALVVLDGLLANPAWKRCAAREQAQALTGELRGELARRSARLAGIKQAMLADQVDEVNRLARELSLPRLPLLLKTVPEGAEVRCGKAVLGTTPLVIDDITEARVEARYTLAKAGYRPVEVGRGEAAAGWRVLVDLQRTAAVEILLPAPVSTPPALLGGRIVVAGSRAVFSVDESGAVQSFPVDGEAGSISRPLAEPVYASPVQIGESVFVTTRDHLALEILGGRLAKRTLTGKSDHPLALFTSPNILDRRILIIAGLDHRLHAYDPYRGTPPWDGAPGAEFAGGPALVGERVLVARRDGALESYLADTGQPERHESLGDRILATWPVADGLAGMSTDWLWRWDGRAPAQRTALPAKATLGGPAAYLSESQRLMRRQADGTWVEKGRVPAGLTLTAPPVPWGDDLVLVAGTTVQVTGAQAFTLTGTSDVLPPLVAGDRLVLVTADGALRVFTR